MQISVKQLEKSQVEVTIELSVEDMQPYLDTAAKRISETKTIQGFRPGKASRDAVIQQVGAMPLWQEAADAAVGKSLMRALQEQKLITVGAPNIAVEKLAPDNPFVFTATLTLLPEVTLADYSLLTLEKKNSGDY